jgi:hypothetical protein
LVKLSALGGDRRKPSKYPTYLATGQDDEYFFVAKYKAQWILLLSLQTATIFCFDSFRFM